jgi:hypothetical protein
MDGFSPETAQLVLHLAREIAIAADTGAMLQ